MKSSSEDEFTEFEEFHSSQVEERQEQPEPRTVVKPPPEPAKIEKLVYSSKSQRISLNWKKKKSKE